MFNFKKKNIKKKRLVILANCQSSALAKTLLENSEFSNTYEWDHIAPIQTLHKKDTLDVIGKVKEADLFIYQPIKQTATRPVELTSDFLLKKLKRKSTPISFPSLYFDGYFPHLQTLMGKTSVLNLVHDYIIAYSCAIGLSEADTLAMIQDERLYPEEISRELAKKSINNLSERENEFVTDIKVSPYISKYYKNIKLFNQFNHPTRPVFKYLAEKIFLIIGLNEGTISESGSGYLDAIMTPIYKSTYENLDLSFNEKFTIYNGLNKAGIKQPDVIKEFFIFYNQQEKKDLIEFIKRMKPFVPKIVDAYI